MDKNYVLDDFDFVFDKMAWTKVLSAQKDEALISKSNNSTYSTFFSQRPKTKCGGKGGIVSVLN